MQNHQARNGLLLAHELQIKPYIPRTINWAMVSSAICKSWMNTGEGDCRR
jgi:hypothetical protein